MISNTKQQDGDSGPEHQDGGLLLEEAKPKLKKPPMYQVVLMNDDYTPMDFVISILEGFFGMNRERAIKVMLNVHNNGKGICGVFGRDIAETKVAQVNDYSRTHDHPLMCTLESNG